MKDKRVIRAKRNISVSLISQAVRTVCGLVVPKLLIEAYGSETYGVTTSILSFLGYITLLQGGVGGVVRAALYKPLAENDRSRVAVILKETERFFRVLAWVFLAYTAVLAVCFHKMAGVTSLDWMTTAFLVGAIAFSTFGEYFFGMSRMVLLNAYQRTYITETVAVITTALNALLVIVMVPQGISLLALKFASGFLFLAKPIVLRIWCNRIYPLPRVHQRDPGALKDKWSGLGQHIAYFLHSNTDVVVLTLLADLKEVAVYSVFYMVISQIQSVVVSFSTGMESMFGDMLAKNEKKELDSTLSFYETMISCISVVLLGTTAVMIQPFVSIYTEGITDVNYYRPMFATIMILASLAYCLRLPYHDMVIAAGKFRETQNASFWEAGLNIALSVVLVIPFGIVGVAWGTLISVGYRYVYYVWYLSGHVIQRKPGLAVKRMLVSAVAFGLSFAAGIKICALAETGNYFQWVVCAVPVVIAAAAITVGMNFLFYRKEAKQLIAKFRRR